METVGSFEAKTHLPQLLERAARGEEFTITRHGKPVARLGPPPSRAARPSMVRLLEAVQAMKDFRKGRTLGNLNIRELIEEGRRF